MPIERLASEIIFRDYQLPLQMYYTICTSLYRHIRHIQVHFAVCRLLFAIMH